MLLACAIDRELPGSRAYPLPVAETQVVVGKGCGALVGKGCELSASCGRGELRAGGSPAPQPGLLR